MLDFRFEIKSLVICAANISALFLADAILSESSISKVLCKTIMFKVFVPTRFWLFGFCHFVAYSSELPPLNRPTMKLKMPLMSAKIIFIIKPITHAKNFSLRRKGNTFSSASGLQCHRYKYLIYGEIIYNLPE